MKLVKMPTKEELEKLAHDHFEESKRDPNNFSFWYPKIKDCGLSVPESVIVPVPYALDRCWFQESPDDMDKIYAWVKTEVAPRIPKNWHGLFMKNGCFSNKFLFSDCATFGRHPMELTTKIANIMYQALCLETGGMTELVLRELITDDIEDYRIYDGMKLRPEYRVFYDFDNRNALYVAEYWDFDYCHEMIYKDETDGIIFFTRSFWLYDQYRRHHEEVFEMVAEHMRDVDMTGIWSVDIMQTIKGEENQYWLIDMATAETSAYWDRERAGLA